MKMKFAIGVMCLVAAWAICVCRPAALSPEEQAIGDAILGIYFLLEGTLLWVTREQARSEK